MEEERFMPFEFGGYCYTEKEAAMIRKVNAMPEGDNKAYAVKAFEVETGKAFPVGVLMDLQKEWGSLIECNRDNIMSALK